MPKRKHPRRRTLWRLYAGRCFWCGEMFQSVRHLTLDELVPLSRGGGTQLENQVPAHRGCNMTRGNMIAPSWAIERHASVVAEDDLVQASRKPAGSDLPRIDTSERPF